MARDLAFPGGKEFAFTVIDDTDGSTLKNLSPIYDLLEDSRAESQMTGAS